MIFSYQIAFDCSDPFALTVFWCGALGLPRPTREEVDAFHAAHPQTVGRGVVQDPAWRHPRIYIQTVPEPKAGRNRIRFDVAGDGDVLSECGGTPAGNDTWTDPAGNEVTVVRGGRPRLDRIRIDALDPASQAAFWAEVLGFTQTGDGCDRPDGLLRIESGQLMFGGRAVHRMFPADAAPPDSDTQQLTPGLTFVKTDERKRRKNRVHFDLNCTDEGDWRAEFERLCALGATPLEPSELDIEPVPEYWNRRGRVMRDPEGNEFCLQAVFEHEWAS